jgi:hypothetical protein
MTPDDTTTPTAAKKPSPKLPDIFPPKLEELKGMTGKKADKKMLKSIAKPPLMPKALQKKNVSVQLIERIKS